VKIIQLSVQNKGNCSSPVCFAATKTKSKVEECTESILLFLTYLFILAGSHSNFLRYTHIRHSIGNRTKQATEGEE